MDMIRRGFLFGFLILLFLACSRTTQQDSSRTICVSIAPQAYFVQRIAGDAFKINVLVPAGAGPETFDPSPDDMKKFANARVCFFSGGLSFENMLAEKFADLKSGPLMVNISEGVGLIKEEGHHEHSHSGTDPHYWMSPREVKRVASNIHKTLSEMDPGQRQVYDKNLSAFLADLDSLDSTMVRSFSDLKTRKFVLFHPSLGYLARDYHLEQLALEFEGKQPSTRQLRTLVDMARKENINTVFLQIQFDLHTIETFSGEIGARLITIDPLSGDWLQNMYRITSLLKEAMDGK